MTPDSGLVAPWPHRFHVGEGAHAATTLLALHGTGGDENDLIELARTILPGAAILSPRGRVLENGMPRFFRRLAEGVFDVPDLIARTHELAGFVREATTHYAFDSSRVVAVGFSNGANIAAAMHLLEPDMLAASVLLRAMVPLSPELPPHLTGKRILIAGGTADPIIPRANTERLAALFGGFGADVTTHWSSGGHSLTPADIEVATRWLGERSTLSAQAPRSS